jgi:hypothetical protein
MAKIIETSSSIKLISIHTLPCRIALGICNTIASIEATIGLHRNSTITAIETTVSPSMKIIAMIVLIACVHRHPITMEYTVRSLETMVASISEPAAPGSTTWSSDLKVARSTKTTTSTWSRSSPTAWVYQTPISVLTSTIDRTLATAKIQIGKASSTASTSTSMAPRIGHGAFVAVSAHPDHRRTRSVLFPDKP